MVGIHERRRVEAGGTPAVSGTRIERLRKAEVQYLDGSRGGELDVGWLQIPMDDAALVRGLERFRNLTGNGQRLVERNGALLDPVRERRPVDQLQHDRSQGRLTGRRGLEILEPVNLRDVRVIERCEQLRLTLEPGEPFGIRREQIRQHFDRDLAIEARVPCAIDFAHAALAEDAEDFIRTETGTCGKRHGLRVRISQCAWGPTPMRDGSTRCARSPGRRRYRPCRGRRGFHKNRDGYLRSGAWARVKVTAE